MTVEHLLSDAKDMIPAGYRAIEACSLDSELHEIFDELPKILEDTVSGERGKGILTSPEQTQQQMIADIDGIIKVLIGEAQLYLIKEREKESK